MKRHIYTALYTLLFSLSATAQETLLQKYEYAPQAYQEVYIDMIEHNPCRTITTSNGQYVGQVDSKGALYGYGMFVNNDGSQIIGQFRNGKLLFGISLTATRANVGGTDYYASYSLNTGFMEYIYRGVDKQSTNAEGLYDYAFVSQKFTNGDQYIGEIYKRQRHGYGVYYYADGSIWFGPYNNGVRKGYGVYINAKNELTIGDWDGEDVRRSIQVKTSKK
ncbi:MAG: hypothetical protein KBT12_07145 [Bacteroidales bacterium]|nr:hypothetical protein [Candidatus Physcousia equi]